MKVFSMNDCDWYAASTLAEAKASYARDVCTESYDVEADPDGIFENPYALSNEQMERLQFHGDADEPMSTPITFREELDRRIAAGVKFPCFFASTEY